MPWRMATDECRKAAKRWRHLTNSSALSHPITSWLSRCLITDRETALNSKVNTFDLAQLYPGFPRSLFPQHYFFPGPPTFFNNTPATSLNHPSTPNPHLRSTQIQNASLPALRVETRSCCSRPTTSLSSNSRPILLPHRRASPTASLHARPTHLSHQPLALDPAFPSTGPQALPPGPAHALGFPNPAVEVEVLERSGGGDAAADADGDPATADRGERGGGAAGGGAACCC